MALEYRYLRNQSKRVRVEVELQFGSRGADSSVHAALHAAATASRSSSLRSPAANAVRQARKERPRSAMSSSPAQAQWMPARSLRSWANSGPWDPSPRGVWTPRKQSYLPRRLPVLTPTPSVFWSRTVSVSRSGHWLLEGFVSGDWLSLAVAQAPFRRWSEVGRAGESRLWRVGKLGAGFPGQLRGAL